MNVTEKSSSRPNMLNLMMQHEEFIVIGLTGRIGSGCSKVAKVLSSSYKDLNLPLITPGYQGLVDDTARDRRILQRYASAHWVKFDIIRVRTAITSFLLSEEKMLALFRYVSGNSTGGSTEEIDETYRDIYKKFCDEVHITETVQKEIPRNNEENSWKSTDLIDALKKLEIKYKDTGSRLKEEVSRHIGGLEDELNQLSAQAAISYITECKDMKQLIGQLQCINKRLDESYHKHDSEADDDDLTIYFEKYLIVHDILPALSNVLRDYIKERGKSYTELFQKLGNYIRFYGDIPLSALACPSICSPSGTETEVNEKPGEDIFALPRKINQFIKVLRHPFGRDACRPVRVVIDSIKNPFEAMYLRQRYSAFYLFAVSTNEQVRIQRLLQERDKQMTMQKILIDGWAEYANAGRDIYLQGKASKLTSGSDEEVFYQALHSEEFGSIMYEDDVRKIAYETNQQQYYLQDVPASIESADVFINNNYASNAESASQELIWALVRNISLIMFPGLLLPTPLERCMQIAFSAKCNSGCLSRQVGAVVTDKNYNILSVGWNDVPCGDISCARKNIVDLCKKEDVHAYSDFELNDEKFRERLKQFNYKDPDMGKKFRGLPARYCFKDTHQDTKNSMRSRAMHAEEKALSSCGDQAIDGSLFTTSSPCEMCSKNAKNHKIKNIYYIELYPGISESNYSHSGEMGNRATHHLFTGAVGRAYMQMYTPIMPQKDVLACLDIGWPWTNNRISTTATKADADADLSIDTSNDCNDL